MTTDKTIFGLPFLSTQNLEPTREQLTAFLETPGNRQAHDLTVFRSLLESIDAFKQKRLPEAEQDDIQKQLFYGVLQYSQFADHTLLSAVELFHYQMRALNAIDFATPASFIESAQATINKLSKKKIDDVTRMLRLQEMISERKKIIATLTLTWDELAAELLRIALYITDNLAKIEERCEVSIIALSDRGVTGKKEREIIEEIKTHFKDVLKSSLHTSKISMQDVQASLKEATLVSEEVSIAIQEDVNTLTGLYEALHEHLQKAIQAIEAVLSTFEKNKGKTPLEKKPFFQTLANALATLLSIHRLEQQATGLHTETTHEALITSKRKEMLAFLFALVQKERRSQTDRRTTTERREAEDPNYRGPERRTSKDRRSGKNRREP
jgi:hypothetical protein